MILFIYAGGCRAGLFGVPSGRSLWTAGWGAEREPWSRAVGSLSSPFSSVLGRLERHLHLTSGGPWGTRSVTLPSAAWNEPGAKGAQLPPRHAVTVSYCSAVGRGCTLQALACQGCPVGAEAAIQPVTSLPLWLQ